MNYPGGVKTNFHKNIVYGNRGMTLENDLNETNQYYLVNNIAIIHKKPTPITISDVDYHSRKDAIITKAYFKTPSTTDYNGIYKGKYIDFEAKETKSKTSFSLSNIHKHQIDHLININNHDGIAFIIVRFTTLDETYLLRVIDFKDYIENTDKKSIPISFFRKKAFLLKNGYKPRIDYLEIVDQLIGGK